jgi:hypothetical protein
MYGMLYWEGTGGIACLLAGAWKLREIRKKIEGR